MNTINIMFVLLMILALSSLACADPTADSLSVSSAIGDPGDTNVLVLVNITNTADGPIMVLGFDVIYDPAVVELVSARRGSDLPTDEFGDPVWDVSLGANKKSIGLTTLEYQDHALPDGFTGNIVRLHFNVNATATLGDYPIEISNVDISSTSLVHGTISTISGTFTVTDTVVDPVLCTSPDPPSNDFGSVPEGKTRTWTFDVTNCGEGTLDWTVSGDQTWITVNPTGGSTTTEADTVTVTINTTRLSDGIHTGTVTATSGYGTEMGTISVDVKDPAPPLSGAVVTIPDVSATGMITVPITIENVSNMGSCQLTLSYDSDVVIVSSAVQSDFDSLFANLEGAASGSVSLLLYQTSSPGLGGDVIVANVTFIAVGNSGSSTPLDLEVTTFTDATPDCNPIPYTIRDGSFTMFLNGDVNSNGNVNGDSRVDVADCMFLAKHLLGASGFETIVEDAADVNGNGVVEASDCMYLAKHLAGMDGFEVLK